MYIFELIAKIFKEKKENHPEHVNRQQENIDYSEKCDHTFFPVDSTGEILACSKCGLMINSDELNVKTKNPFF